MSTRDKYIRKSQQLRTDIVGLRNKKALATKKVAEASQKAQRAALEARNSKSESTRRTKERENERQLKIREQAEFEIASLEKKIARKENDLIAAQKSLDAEDARLTKRRLKEEQARHKLEESSMKTREKKMVDMSRQIQDHETRIAMLSQLPEVITVLFLAANPRDLPHLALDEEIRDIADRIRKSEHRDSVRLESRWAIRPPDLFQAFNELSPEIVHFSGHGSSTDEIVFVGKDGDSKSVSKEAIVQLMAASGGFRLVFFNTCFSSGQAQAVVKHVEAAIGMKTSIGDEAARVFATQFYSAIGFGKSLQMAFDQAKTMLMMEGIPEEDTPQLFVAEGVDAAQMVIVRPPTVS